ncbi:MAG: pyruvate, phosphate dikinase [Hyphomicrobiaceae bacterium]
MTKPVSGNSTAPAAKHVYVFANGRADGDASMIRLLGGKGANLAEMASLGLPVPPGFTITTQVCAAYYENGEKLPDHIQPEIEGALADIGHAVGATFGDPNNPLLVSVRSGARASMPGMMDTILNLGLNDETVVGLAARSGDPRFAYDSYRRFIQMYANVVLGVDHGVFEDILENYKNLNGLSSDNEVDAPAWQNIIVRYQKAIESETGAPFPSDLNAQLWGAIAAVFSSWKSARALTYRRLHDIPERWGTAVTVQAMVFGNLGNTSATGVAFTRNPSTGAPDFYGEFLINAQGEDVVAGIRTPQVLTEAGKRELGAKRASLESAMPKSFEELSKVFKKLEAHYRDMQDIEFTIQDGHLWILQTRSGKRTTEAALRIAVDMAADGLITPGEAVMRVDPSALNQLLHPTIDPSAERTILATGLPASPGAACGEIVFTPDDAEAASSKGRTVILVRSETSPEDIHGMHAAVGILTARGGMTSHAAVVARGMGRPCVVGASTLRIDAALGTMTAGREVLRAGDIITIDGGTGQVLKGEAKMRQPEMSGAFGQMMTLADSVRRLEIRANADTPRDAQLARDFGAQGIGLCRTEHMFFDQAKILAMREMICAGTEQGRRAALAKILVLQRRDFEQLFEIMAGLPVTIRLLDPPLHEFLPEGEAEIGAVAASLGITATKLRARIAELHEVNPMLGFRGCRLAIRYPEIAEMQVRAILEAAIAAAKKTGLPVTPEIMIPLIVYRAEFDILRKVIVATAAAVQKETGTPIAYETGSMIELPRACLRAFEIVDGAEGAAFISFGTNDLTQTALGLSRDDASPILSSYQECNILDADPFTSIDEGGAGELVVIGVERARKAKPGIKIGVCGEHGGDPKSITFFHNAGLDYVSCSPFRVPVARLAAAQAAINAAAIKIQSMAKQ